jgi:hypothetical protein
MLSDIHWDNPKCKRDELKKDLDYCLKNDIPILINGDFFCLMQGRGDRRSNKSDIRPEHNNFKYIDSVIETAVDWWMPYAHLILVIGYGNHETAIIKWQETDVLQRFVDLLNARCGTAVQTGGYGGWLIVNQYSRGTASGISTKIKYYHGSGGGGIVTKGAINLTRALEIYEGFDVFSMGHIHENASRNDVREVVVHKSKIGYQTAHKQIHLMLTGTYKEEYEDGYAGFHVERGAPPKPIGGRILEITMKRETKDNVTKMNKYIDSYKFPA